MRKYSNINIESIDSFCSVFGNELIFEKKDNFHLLLPCLNLGFYENPINIDVVTKAFEQCYLIFEIISKVHIELHLYNSVSPNKKNEIDISGSVLKYVTDIEKKLCKTNNEYLLEGICFRNNSFSYATLKIYSESLNIIVGNNYCKLIEYTCISDNYKTDEKIIDFLLNHDSNICDVFLQS